MIKGNEETGKEHCATMELPIVFESRSAAETESFGRALGESLLAEGKTDAFLALYGDLGAGKTAFVRGLASAVTPGAHVCSPTYTIVNEYRGGGRVLCHLDLYRIEGEDDLYSVGFYDYEGVMMAAEWCEKAPFALPESYLRITIEKTGDESRRIMAEAIDSASQG